MDQKELIGALYWMVLGDGSLGMQPRSKQAFFQLTHIPEYADYLKAKAEILEEVTSVTIKQYFHSRAGKYFLQLYAGANPVFTALYRELYSYGRKVLTPHALKVLTPRALAILFQDDGRCNEEHYCVSINKPMFTKLEMEALAKAIVDRYGLIFRVRKSAVLKDGSQGYELALRYKDWPKFVALISQYVAPSMQYKIPKGSFQEPPEMVMCSELHGDVQSLAEMTKPLPA